MDPRVGPPGFANRAPGKRLSAGRELRRRGDTMALTPTRTRFSSYEEARASHKWEVPDRYNIAADVCDKHPHDKLAMLIVCSPDQADRMPGDLVDEVLLLDDELLRGADDRFETVDTAADDPAQLYYSSGTTGLAKGILHAHRYVLAHEEFIYCHDVRDGELFHGMGEWAWAAGIAPLLGPWRFGATQFVYAREGGFDPAKQLEVLSKHGVTNVFTTPTAMRAMMAIEDAGERFPQRFRIVCSAGEPLNPEAIRWFRNQYGITVRDYYGLTESYPLW